MGPVWVVSAALVILSAAFWISCQRKSPPSSPAKPPQEKAAAEDKNLREWSGVFSGISDFHRAVVQDPEEWKSLWRKAFGEEVPEVDFEKYFAAAVFMGAKNTGGYWVEFLDPVERKGKWVVRYRLHSPGPGSFVIQAFTRPFAVKLFEKKNLKIVLEEAR